MTAAHARPSTTNFATRTLVSSALSVVTSMLPVMLLGSLAVLVREELGFSEARLGMLVSGFFAASALASVPGGRFGERFGATIAIRTGAAGSAIAMVGVAVLATEHVHLLAWFALAGVANGLSQPGTNLAIAIAIPPERRSLAMGLKQTAGPATAMLAGLAVPVLGLTLGWRWAFVVTALVALVVTVVVPGRGLGPRTDEVHVGAPRRTVVDAPLVLLTIAVGTALLAGSAVGAFYVESSVAAGLPVSTAGTFLAVGGVTGILGRIMAGWLGGLTHRRHLRLAAAIMAAAALGHLGLGLAGSHGSLLAATLLTFAAGWGYYSLFIYAVIHLYAHAPAASTGVVHTGAFAGGVLGPVSFGAIVEGAGYRTAWTATASAFLLAAFLMMLSDLWMARRAIDGP